MGPPTLFKVSSGPEGALEEHMNRLLPSQSVGEELPHVICRGVEEE
jgi:hypothetical protein